MVGNRKRVLISFGNGRKRTLLGLKNAWHGGPRIIPFKNTFYQTRPSERLETGTSENRASRAEDLVFNPGDYISSSVSESKDLAWEDAQNHKHFYETLIKKGYYPKETKVKIKKRKHSNDLILELSVPKVKMLREYIKERNSKLGGLTGEERRNYQETPKNIGNNIQHEAEMHGYTYFDPKFPNAPITHEDVFAERNYGVDSKGVVRYIDRHILYTKLPFTKRKKSGLEKNLERSRRYMNEDEENHSNGGNKTFLLFFGILFIILSLFFLSSDVTGNIVSIQNLRIQNSWGFLLFLIGVILTYFSIKQY